MSEQGFEPVESEKSDKPKPDWMNQVDAELAFRLVDSILPFEACLYHQMLPLSLEGSRLKLGMVNPDDTAALDYVRRILAYMNCSLVPQPIASDVHYAALSAYLSYSDQQKKNTNPSAQPVARRIAKKLAEQSAKRAAEPQNDRAKNPHAYPTLVVDSPAELPPLPIESESEVERSQPTFISPVDAQSAEAFPFNPLFAAPDDPTIAEPPAPTVVNLPANLEINPQYLSAPPEILATLPPHKFLEEILGRVLSWGIGRLYLERKADYSRILWSQNGSVQAVLEELPLDTFEQVLRELKQLAQLSPAIVPKPKQVEVERMYQHHRLLLRLRVMPGQHGEEATLQVLRGAALRFYRQQQLVTLGQEALNAAQQFQQKLSEMYTHSDSYSVALPDHLSILPELNRTLKRLNYQLTEIQALRVDETPEEDS